MRSVAVVGLLGTLAATPALACPTRVACITTDVLSSGRSELPAAPRLLTRTARLELRLPFVPRAEPRAELGQSLLTFSPPIEDELAMPWIWQVLRTQVYGRLPRIEPGAQDFSMVLSPVVVAGSFDTVPGFGVAGDF